MPLTVTDVHVQYGEIRVLNGASLNVMSGESVAIMGPSGSGKSTLMAVIAGELEPQQGHVIRSPEQQVEWIFQSAPVLSRRSALDNVALGALARGHGRGRSTALARRAMRSLGIERLSAMPAYKLSGGERQRVAVARAIASGSPLILADEPTAALDAGSKQLVIEALTVATRSGASLVVATHDEEVARACDCTYRLRAGAFEKARFA